MNEVSNNYIEKAIDDLISILGVKECINHEKIYDLIHERKTKEAIKEIALHLGLPIDVNITYVPKGYRANSQDQFQSTHLVKTGSNGQGVGGITAQVSIPSNLPLYGSAGMKDFVINVKLSEDCTKNAASFITVMSHELSHIVLYSMWHREKENEFFTDLTPIILGFADVIKIGRKMTDSTYSVQYGLVSNVNTTSTLTTTYGYLTDDNFNCAYNKIQDILGKRRFLKDELLKKAGLVKKQLGKVKKLSTYFAKYLEYLDQNHDKKISQDDGCKIILFHQAGYGHDHYSIIEKSNFDLETLSKFTNSLTNYTSYNMEAIKKYESQLKLDGDGLTKSRPILIEDVAVLERYVGFLYKLKVKFGL